jgi:hypothetical protein
VHFIQFKYFLCFMVSIICFNNFFEFLFMSIHDYVCTYVLHLVVVLHVLCCCVIFVMCVTCRFDDTPLKAWHKVLG